MQPQLNSGEYVFVTLKNSAIIPRSMPICEFKEKEGTTLVLEKRIADQYNLKYEYIASWITLNVHSALEAVGLTAAFSTTLTNHGISANVIAGYFHDHIFIDKKSAKKAMQVLLELSGNYEEK